MLTSDASQDGADPVDPWTAAPQILRYNVCRDALATDDTRINAQPLKTFFSVSNMVQLER